MTNVDLTIEQHRTNTIKELNELLQHNNKVCCVRYTGYGKTYYIIKELVQIYSDCKFLMLVPTTSLITQYNNIFGNYNNVIIDTYQNIGRKDISILYDMYKNINFIVCDECHHLINNVWGYKLNLLFNKLNNVKMIGFTATPLRTDGIDIRQSFFHNVSTSEFNLLDGIACGFVPKLKYIYAYCDVPNKYISKHNIKLSDIDRYQIQNLINVPSILSKHIPKDIITNNYKIIVYISRLNYINSTKIEIYNWFKQAFPHKNINIYEQGSNREKPYNRNELNKFISNKNKQDVDIIIAVNMLSEGIHIPEVDCIIMLRKTVSPVVFSQQIGRTINGNKPVIFDLVNNKDNINILKHKYIIVNNFGNGVNRNKIMFDDICVLKDETTDIDKILSKYYTYTAHILTPEIKQKILSEDNLSVKYLCQKYGYCQSTIRNILTEAGIITPKPLRKPLTDEERQNICNDRINGVRMTDIAKKYNICMSTVSSVVSRAGLTANTMLDDKKLKRIINENRSYIDSNNGVIKRSLIAQRLNISEQQLNRGMDLCNISKKRLYPRYIMNKSLLENIRQDLKQGITGKQIEQKYNITNYVRKKYYKELGVASRSITKPLTDEDKQYILDNYKHKTTSEISKHLSVHVSRVTHFLNSNNLPFKSINSFEPITQEEELQICKLYEQLGSLYGVHKNTGRHKETIKRIVIKHGYKINGKNNKEVK